MPRLLVHADDFGASPTINRMILRGVDEGCLNSLSLMATGHAFEDAVKELKSRPELDVAIHLNVWEGQPLADPQKVTLLVDQSGQFKHSYVSLWHAWRVATPADRGILQQQLGVEWRAQWRRIRDALGQERPLGLDSHVHFHLIPFAFDTALSVAEEDPRLDYVRVVREPWWVYGACILEMHRYINANPVKHALLRHLSRRAIQKLASRNIPYNDVFLGVLYTGGMTTAVARSLLKELQKKNFRFAQLLFHPGQASLQEEVLWGKNIEALAPQRSPMRQRELDAVLDASVCEIVKNIQAKP